jgi:DNA repair protein RecO (recombination protein O)
MSTTFSTEAVVLSRHDFKSDGGWVSLFTDRYGKIEALAKGIRKARSKLTAHLQPLTLTEVFIVRGRNNLLVAGSVPINNFPRMRNDLSKILSGGSLCQLVDICSPLDVADDRESALLKDSLILLEETDLNRSEHSLVVHCFAWQLLVLLGLKAELDFCGICHLRLSDETLVFSARAGSFYHRRCSPADPAQLIPTELATVKGLKLMASAPLKDCLRLRSANGALQHMKVVVESIMEERFEIPRAANLWLN